MKNGSFVISLDFELNWGAPEKRKLLHKKHYFNNTRESIPKVLDLFTTYNIHATWATVGFLFAKSKEQLLSFCPKERPAYSNERLSYYKLIDRNEVGKDELEDPYHYAYSLISKIVKTPNQELGTHTFAHYYCNEPGQNILQFDADLKAAQNLSKENFNIELKSLVFPRNQFNSDYVSIAKQNGIRVVRSNPDVWFWKRKLKIVPLARAFDTLLPISDSLSFTINKIPEDEILLLPASRFLRPFSQYEKFLQKTKLNRIKAEMTYAAKKNEIYHLWWHPHNLGNSTHENLLFLETILKHYKFLNETYKFTSYSMNEMHR